MARLLLTSFVTWLPHQKSNAADDLLLKIQQRNLSLSRVDRPIELHFLRQLPVDFVLAPQQAIARIQQLQPQIVVCCGMAESRLKLSVESQAVNENHVIKTRFDLPQLVAELPMTEISEDAGRFACNATYYAVLNYLQNSPGLGLFVHVPILNNANQAAIVADFEQLLKRLSQTTEAGLQDHCLSEFQTEAQRYRQVRSPRPERSQVRREWRHCAND